MTTRTLDACLQLLADRRRRQVLHHLREEPDGTTTFDDLVDGVYGLASGANDDPPCDRRALAVQLQHVHLPKLADHGVVEFEHGSGAVRYRPDERLERVLDSLPGEASARPIDAEDPPSCKG